MRALMARSRTIVITLLSAWALLLLVTHRGSRSPYTYIAQMAGSVDRVANRDALAVLTLTRFFYDGSRAADWSKVPNLKLPTHSFAVSTAAAFVRPYLLANEVTNFLFIVLLIVAAMRFAARFGVSDRSMLLALATILALPAFVGYLGQPMHYIVGPVINYLVIMTAIALPERDLRNPWIAGALTAILTLNYDWYVFGAALLVHLAILRFDSRRHDAIYVFVAAAPVLTWTRFISFLSGGTASSEVFIVDIYFGWLEFLRAPAQHILLPFIASHLGVHIGAHEILALIFWPLLVACAIALWKSRPLAGAHRIVLLLPLIFFLEQLATAAFDWENNPRRALPVLFAFGCAYCWVVGRYAGNRKWAAAFLALFALTAFLAFADVALNKPGAGFLYMGEAIRHEPKEALRYEDDLLRIAPSKDPETAVVLRSFPAARLDLAGAFMFAQLFVAFWMCIFFVLLRRAELLPRFAPAAFVAVWLLSALRFL